MKEEKINFTNQEGVKLAAKLGRPPTGEPEAYALFAHCFTCTKNLLAVKSISSSLTAMGFGVLSFDFTGLGQSEGEFSETNFSSNVEDILAASDFLRAQLKAPLLLIGHSLGGTAVLFASSKIKEVQAVATIGAPAGPEHVEKLFEDQSLEIRAKGEALVSIGGRPFMIKKQFLENLRKHKLSDLLPGIRKAFLFAHSPQDRIVGINNAAELYGFARHPKSFISLNGADHLLSDKQDAAYLGKVIAVWADRYIARQS